MVGKKVESISPLAVINEAARALPQPDGYMEKEELWVEISGEQHGEKKTTLMECLVPTLPDWKEAGCNIDTGFPASIIAQMVKDGRIKERGSFAPEAVVPEAELFQALGENSIIISKDNVVINRDALPKHILPRVRRQPPALAEAFI